MAFQGQAGRQSGRQAHSLTAAIDMMKFSQVLKGVFKNFHCSISRLIRDNNICTSFIIKVMNYASNKPHRRT